MQDPEEAPASQLQISPALAFEAIYGLNQEVEDLSHCLSLPVTQV